MIVLGSDPAGCSYRRLTFDVWYLMFAIVLDHRAARPGSRLCQPPPAQVLVHGNTRRGLASESTSQPALVALTLKSPVRVTTVINQAPWSKAYLDQAMEITQQIPWALEAYNLSSAKHYQSHPIESHLNPEVGTSQKETHGSLKPASQSACAPATRSAFAPTRTMVVW